MQQLVVAVCDEDSGYGRKLSEYWMQKPELGKVRYIGQADELSVCLEKGQADVCLVSPGLLRTLEKKEAAAPVICLAEETVTEELTVYPCICKYQSADEILRQVYGCLACRPAAEIRQNYRRGCTIGSCTPWYSGGVLLAGLALGRYLSEKGRVLYINARGCHGWSGETAEDNGRNLSDIILSLREETGNGGAVVRSGILAMGKVDYIVPVQAARQLEGMESEDLSGLLEVVWKELQYDYVILELDSELAGIAAVLEQCDRVYGFLPPSYGTEQLRQSCLEELKEWKPQLYEIPWKLYEECGRMSSLPPDMAAGALADWIRTCMNEEEQNGDEGEGEQTFGGGDKEAGAGTHGRIAPDG